MTELVDLYFRRVNLAISLLHRPTFDSAVADGLHLRDTGFGAIVLLVCAAASRFSDDLRVILPGTGSYHSAGWKWFKQVGISSYSISASATLYELQVLCVRIIPQAKQKKNSYPVADIYYLPAIFIYSPCVLDDGWHWYSVSATYWGS